MKTNMNIIGLLNCSLISNLETVHIKSSFCSPSYWQVCVVGYCDKNEGGSVDVGVCICWRHPIASPGPRVVLSPNFVALLLVGCYTLVAPIGGARFRWLSRCSFLIDRPATSTIEVQHQQKSKWGQKTLRYYSQTKELKLMG